MRRIRALGLAAVAALALTVLPASASAFGGLEADKYPVFLLAEDVSEGQTIGFYDGVSTQFCTNVEAKFEAALKGPSGTVVASPTWKGCSFPITANGCKFEFHPGSEDSFDIGPPGCGPITTEDEFCKYAIGAQTGLPATYKNVGTGSSAKVMIEIDTDEIEYTISGFICGKGTYTDGEYEGAWEVMAGSENGMPVGIHAVDQFPTGFFITGKAAEKEAEQPRFSAEKYPTVIRGGQVEAHEFIPSVSALYGYGEGLQCEDVGFDTEVTGSTATLSVAASYTGCDVIVHEFPTTINMNSCRYVFNLLNIGPPYAGTMDIVCTKEGDAIETKWFPTWGGSCTVRTGPQKGLKSVTFANVGEGSKRGVEIDFEVKGIESTFLNGPLLCGVEKNSTHKDGTYTGSSQLFGIY